MVKVVRKSVSVQEAERQEKAAAVLKELGVSSQEGAAEHLAQTHGLPYVDLAIFPIDGDHIRLMPRDFAQAHGAVIFQKERGLQRIGFVDPENQAAREALLSYGKERGIETLLYVISEASLKRAWQEYDKKPFIEHLDHLRISLSGEELAVFEQNFGELLSLKENTGTIPTSRVMEIILAGANKLGASDVHIEPEEHEVRMRYRIDGTLQDIGHLPEALYRLTLSRIKMLAKMKLNVRDRSQDGHFFIMQKGKRVDIRVSIIPSNHGETINMRLLDNAEANVPLEDLGVRGSAYEEIKKHIEKPHGMIVNTGPTGSGKTTTLYSLLREVNDPSVKIITVEDPIEYQLPGVVQTEANGTGGYAFGQALRAIVRQDPDIILVGEIRDEETAEVAINAALTGHLVLTTLHTNDAPASIVRLAELGIKGSLIGSAVNLFIGQRLVRTLCPECKAAYVPAPRTIAALKKILALIPKTAGVAIPETAETLYRPVGCTQCNFLGYRGRKGIFEVFPVSDHIAAVINSYATEAEIREAAKKEGMMTMTQDGILKVIDGLTTFQEVWRNAGQEEALEGLYQEIMADPGFAEPELKMKNPSV